MFHWILWGIFCSGFPQAFGNSRPNLRVPMNKNKVLISPVVEDGLACGFYRDLYIRASFQIKIRKIINIGDWDLRFVSIVVYINYLLFCPFGSCLYQFVIYLLMSRICNYLLVYTIFCFFFFFRSMRIFHKKIHILNLQ